MSRVAVLKGGRSLERQVSLRSGARVEDALGRLGHDVIAIDAGLDLIRRLRESAPEAAFIAMHGRDGEDGTVQELLEILGVPYTGSGVLACLRATDKVLAKHLMLEAGIPTPEFVAFSETAFRALGAAETLAPIEERLGFPLVVKPSSQGSALGIKFARRAADVPAALVAAFSYDSRVLLERYVDGRDLAVSILAGEPLPVVEALPRDEPFYDFEARYEIGRTEFVCPADLPGGLDARAAGTRPPDLRAAGLLGLCPRRPHAGARRRADRPRGERRPGAHRDEPAPPGRGGRRHRLRRAGRPDARAGVGAGAGLRGAAPRANDCGVGGLWCLIVLYGR